MPARAAPSPTEPRGAIRHKVFLPAEMSVSAIVHRVHLLNLSPAGALIHGDVIPLAGAVVQLSCAGATWLARVVWAQNKRFGVVHTATMPAARIEALLASQRR